MNKPKVIRFKNSTWSPCVCAIDDAWFEGTICSPNVFDTFELGGIHKTDDPLNSLLTALEEKPSLMTHPEGQYLRLLAKLCLKHRFELALGNFEALNGNWNLLNQKGTSILLDLNYTRCPNDEDAGNYGLNLIHRLLNGNRPNADVFIVTGNPNSYAKLMSMKIREATWWPIRSFPVVSKENPDDLGRDLNCFASYFEQGNLEPPIVLMLRTLVRAHNENYKWTHPEDFELEVPPDLPLRALYKGSLSAIRALYHNEQRNQRRADYYVPSSVLSSLLSTSGFVIKSGDDDIWLPWAPRGILWLCQLWHLLHSLCARKETGQFGTISVEQSRAKVEIPLATMHAGEFLAAYNGTSGARAGYAAEALKDIRRGNITDKTLKDLIEDERRVAFTCIENVKILPTTTRSPAINVHVDNTKILISWSMN